MKIALLTLNKNGYAIAAKINAELGNNCTIFQGKQNYFSWGQLVEDIYGEYDALVFIMATGIVVRSIAPLLTDKANDPAILVLDPAGRFVISLLSGHLGGANKLAGKIAEILDAQAVITTATDVLGKRSIEDWAEYYDLGIDDIRGLVKINSALLKEEQLILYTALEPSYFEQYPLAEKNLLNFKPISDLQEKEGLDSSAISLAISFGGGWSKKVTLELIIRDLVIGIGCQKGTSEEKLIDFLEDCLQQEGLKIANIKKFVSIDLKKGEKGLLGLARHLKRPLEFFTSDQLARILEANLDLNYSKFVNKTVGVGGVCEPAAILGSKRGELIMRKTCRAGMTMAIVKEKLPLWA